MKVAKEGNDEGTHYDSRFFECTFFDWVHGKPKKLSQRKVRQSA